ncbi:MAG TPA: DUF6484 domain-containing protein [Acidobacteriota bacterium]|nr:DUF6484 domain-containing protein [Acidobacteriota bacterium]
MRNEQEMSSLEIVLSAEATNHAGGQVSNPDGLVIGTLSGFGESGEPLVVFSGTDSEGPVGALSVVTLDRDAVGRSVALQFEEGDRRKPVILGVIQSPIDAVQHLSEEQPGSAPKRVDVELDGDRLVFTADKEIVLRCGKSSITLTRAGKIIIRGAYLLSRSSGVNRIKGGSVQIN